MIRSLLDAEMQKKILGETLEKELTFEEVVKLAQNFESAELSSGLIMKTGPEANKISEENTKTPKYKRCGHCGNRHKGDNDQESREKFCWAWKLNCNKCKIKGHVAKVSKTKKVPANVIDYDGDNNTEEATLSFKLFNISKHKMVAQLSHTGIN